MKERLSEFLQRSHMVSALGVFAAGLLLVELNALGARHFTRIDVSAGAKYSLSDATKRVVPDLAENVKVTILLERSHPLLPELRQVLVGYQALTKRLRIEYLDPDVDTVEFLAFSKRIEMEAETLRGGPSETAAVVAESAGRIWVIPSSRLSSVDDDGNPVLRVEQELTEALVRVQGERKQRVCFVTGHGEASVDDQGPGGLIELRRRLERSNLEVERVPLDVPSPQGAINGCDVIAVVGPERPWPAAHAAVLSEAVGAGTPAVVLLDPIVDARGRTVSSGLEAPLQLMGAIAEPALILETAPDRRLPGGFGESFFAEAKVHALSEGLTTEAARMDSRVIVTGAVPLRVFPGAPAVVALVTSAQANRICDLDRPELPSCDTDDSAGKPKSGQAAPLGLAIALETGTAKKRVRFVTIGSTSLAQNATFLDPAAHGSRVFVENAFAWVTERSALVSIPEASITRAGVQFSEESLEDLLLYVLVYIPLLSAVLGGIILIRRRQREIDSDEGESST